MEPLFWLILGCVFAATGWGAILTLLCFYMFAKSF